MNSSLDGAGSIGAGALLRVWIASISSIWHNSFEANWTYEANNAHDGQRNQVRRSGRLFPLDVAIERILARTPWEGSPRLVRRWCGGLTRRDHAKWVAGTAGPSPATLGCSRRGGCGSRRGSLADVAISVLPSPLA